ncbi:MAG: sodium/proline symporter [Nitrospinota bacterium]|nr:sodium/proline symporter [Nitrospinota bacterium]MEC8957125.1 sodium/proline symporter [Nitrospinota bacterium]MEE3253187.1 sodium/proline symporter [Nitrospinota bacterium]
MTELSGTITVVFFIYVLVMLGIGWVTSRQTRSSLDFFLADRSLKAWVTAVSSTASSESAWAVLGTVGLAYKEGLSAIWFLPGCLMGYLINWFFIAEKIRKRSEEIQAVTLPDYIENYFNDKNHLLRLISVVIIFSCMIAYVAAQFTAIGKMFDAIFGVPHILSITIGGAIVLGYTMMGGVRAVAWTDFIQGLIMVFGLLVLSIAATSSLGGFPKMLIEVEKISPETLEWMGGKSTTVFIGSMVGLLGIGLGYPGQPHVVTRYMAAKDTRAIKNGTWIALGWGLLMYSSSILLGICGQALFPGLEDPEHLFPKAAEQLLPIFLTAIVLTGVLSAIMSTVSAQILVAASTVAHDIYSKMLNQSLSNEKIIFVSRLTVLLLGLGAIFIALGENRVIFWFVLFAWSGLGASFGPLILFILYWKKVTRQGAIAGMLTGFGTTLVWKISGLSESFIYELVPAFLISCISIYFVSQATNKNF